MRAFAFTSILVAAASGSSEASPSAPATSPVAATMGAPETTCSTDPDCAATNLVVAGENTCCYACGYSFAATKRWIEAFEASCPGYLEAQHRQCAGLRCRGGVLTTECSSGVCKIKLRP